jgi:hypothetical protein
LILTWLYFKFVFSGSIGLLSAEPLLLLEDLNELNPPPPTPPPEAAPPPGKNQKQVKKKESMPDPPPIVAPSRPSVIPTAWLDQMKEKSGVKGEVSTAHRILVSERDASLDRFAHRILMLIDENRVYYGKILQQEDSWNERWKSQVQLLKEGKL